MYKMYMYLLFDYYKQCNTGDMKYVFNCYIYEIMI